MAARICAVPRGPGPRGGGGRWAAVEAGWYDDALHRCKTDGSVPSWRSCPLAPIMRIVTLARRTKQAVAAAGLASMQESFRAQVQAIDRLKGSAQVRANELRMNCCPAALLLPLQLLRWCAPVARCVWRRRRDPRAHPCGWSLPSTIVEPRSCAASTIVDP